MGPKIATLGSGLDPSVDSETRCGLPRRPADNRQPAGTALLGSGLRGAGNNSGFSECRGRLSEEEPPSPDLADSLGA
jgi:hypothetical protein